MFHCSPAGEITGAWMRHATTQPLLTWALVLQSCRIVQRGTPVTAGSNGGFGWDVGKPESACADCEEGST